MRPQIASPNVYRQQSERTSQIHIKTAQIGGKVFFSFPFLLGEFSHCADKSFWKWGVRGGAHCFVAKSLDAKEE
jgi:hypothetical protein